MVQAGSVMAMPLCGSRLRHLWFVILQVADHAYWENYLTTDRYFKNMLSLPRYTLCSF